MSTKTFPFDQEIAWQPNLAGALLMLLVQTPLPHQLVPEALISLVDWLLVWPVMAAMRGVLLGGGLAVLFISLRLIIKSAQ